MRIIYLYLVLIVTLITVSSYTTSVVESPQEQKRPVIIESLDDAPPLSIEEFNRLHQEMLQHCGDSTDNAPILGGDCN